MSSNTKDLQVLTSDHVFTIEPLNSPPNPDLSHLNLSHHLGGSSFNQCIKPFEPDITTNISLYSHENKKWTKPSTPINVDT